MQKIQTVAVKNISYIFCFKSTWKRDIFASNQQKMANFVLLMKHGCQKSPVRLKMWSKNTAGVNSPVCLSSKNHLTYTLTLQIKTLCQLFLPRANLTLQAVNGRCVSDSEVFDLSLAALHPTGPAACVGDAVHLLGYTCVHLLHASEAATQRSDTAKSWSWGKKNKQQQQQRARHSFTNTTANRTVSTHHQETWCYLWSSSSSSSVCLRGARDDETPLMRHCGPHLSASPGSRVCVEGVEEKGLFHVRWKPWCCKNGHLLLVFLLPSAHTQLFHSSSSPFSLLSLPAGLGMPSLCLLLVRAPNY